MQTAAMIVTLKRHRLHSNANIIHNNPMPRHVQTLFILFISELLDAVIF